MPCILSISTPAAIAACSGVVLYKDVTSKEKEISCQALSDPLGCKPHILYASNSDWRFGIGPLGWLVGRNLKTQTATHNKQTKNADARVRPSRR